MLFYYDTYKENNLYKVLIKHTNNFFKCCNFDVVLEIIKNE